ncbi:Uncharacterised protein [Bordetella pertussis]|nr:Uncharacterised protein [Bordetella pertussis]CPM50597.1 Uncharacterised protein [Bordetella pertussis]CPN26565.1 Uncharacterised protein [Bordetella pertussis]
MAGDERQLHVEQMQLGALAVVGDLDGFTHGAHGAFGTVHGNQDFQHISLCVESCPWFSIGYRLFQHIDRNQSWSRRLRCLAPSKAPRLMPTSARA